jgi:CheY-like chemotaxis protein
MVMLVDDNDTDNLISRRILELSGFAGEVVVKNSGVSALDYLTQHSQTTERLPDLIFLDINMPMIDGFAFLEKYGHMINDMGKESKVIVLSSSDNKSEIERITSNPHVVTFLTKPLTPKALKDLAA